MTVRGKHNMDPQVRKKIGRLMQLHAETHPKRIAQRYGVTAEYCRVIWTRLQPDEMEPAREIIAALLAPNPAA